MKRLFAFCILNCILISSTYSFSDLTCNIRKKALDKARNSKVDVQQFAEICQGVSSTVLEAGLLGSVPFLLARANVLPKRMSQISYIAPGCSAIASMFMGRLMTITYFDGGRESLRSFNEDIAPKYKPRLSYHDGYEAIPCFNEDEPKWLMTNDELQPYIESAINKGTGKLIGGGLVLLGLGLSAARRQVRFAQASALSRRIQE